MRHAPATRGPVLWEMRPANRIRVSDVRVRPRPGGRLLRAVRHPRRVRKWTEWDLNPRLPPCEGGDLPLIYRPAGPPHSPVRDIDFARTLGGAPGPPAVVVGRGPSCAGQGLNSAAPVAHLRGPWPFASTAPAPGRRNPSPRGRTAPCGCTSAARRRMTTATSATPGRTSPSTRSAGTWSPSAIRSRTSRTSRTSRRSSSAAPPRSASRPSSTPSSSSTRSSRTCAPSTSSRRTGRRRSRSTSGTSSPSSGGSWTVGTRTPSAGRSTSGRSGRSTPSGS